MRIDAVRAKVATRFAETLGSELGKKLEIVLWNHVLRVCEAKGHPLEWNAALGTDSFRELYTQKALHIDLWNLRRNDALRRRLVDGELPLKRFVKMKPWEIRPEFWEPLFEKAALRAMRKQLTVDVDAAPSGAFVCSRCKSDKTVYYQMQTRAADEPMTNYCSCLNCGKRWKS